MSSREVSHKSSHRVHSSSLDRLVLDELQNLVHSKDTLDLDYPSCKRRITHDDMWRIARLKLLERLCDPHGGTTEFHATPDTVRRDW